MILVRVQKEKRRAREKNPYLLRKYINNHKKMLVELGILKAILVRSQVEMRNRLFKAGGKLILVIKWRGTWLNCILVFCGWLNF